MLRFESIFAASGLLLVSLCSLLLHGKGALSHNQNSFAIRGSGYGSLLARLSQDTVNKVWHYGIEQVNPENHDHDHEHDCDHDHGCDHEHGDEDAHLRIAGDTDGHEDQDHLQDHNIAQNLQDHYANTDASDGLAGQKLLPVSGLENESLFHTAKELLDDLRGAKYERTNPHGLTELHKKKVARDIETMLLRSYRMDPTDYGVYNAYYLFLTIHEYRATPVSREHAKLIANLTISEAAKETESPFAWLTAASAIMDGFFLEQQSGAVPVENVRQSRDRLHYCLEQYLRLRRKAISEGRWERIGVPRREEADTRFRFLLKASGQFNTLLKKDTFQSASATTTSPSANS